uniref:Transcription initiation factor TFIID subunit 5 (Trinotate prediction) n=1 Tax=Henneguya salminicola TaxID=69463 RepID=A0A6G3MG79_HENSL
MQIELKFYMGSQLLSLRARISQNPIHPYNVGFSNSPLAYNKLANHMVCPESSRIPYYDMYLCQKNKPRTEFESTFMQNKWADNASRQNLSASLPSACVYTILNSRNKFLLPSKRIRTNNTVFTDDSSLLAAGMSNSAIKIWSLTFQKLKMYKPIEELQKNDKSSFDIYDKVLNERNCPDNCTFEGHSGSVYGLCFNPYNTLLLSGASDGHIRLWQMYTHSCLSLYKGHVSVVWDVQFCPRGYYFSSCGNDQTVRLWSVENDSPLRLLVGHYSDVYCSKFHPNSNYLATGSIDRTVRIWDLVSGMSVRLFSGFKVNLLFMHD